jgi:tripartite-type tricarboxylate transporter receptor subunit TctC
MNRPAGEGEAQPPGAGQCGLLRLAAALALLALGVAATHVAPPYPSKPVRMIVAVPAGGSADILARLVAPRLGVALGQSVIVDNRPGANGNIAYELAARAAPDGYITT